MSSEATHPSSQFTWHCLHGDCGACTDPACGCECHRILEIADGPEPPTPLQAKRLPPACFVCGCAMTLPGGYGGSGMCGVCATGEVGLLDEFGRPW